MNWEEFYGLWTAYVGKIERETLREWMNFTSSANAAVIRQAVMNIAERFHSRTADFYTPPPNLWQLRNEYNNLLQQKNSHRAGCRFCHNSGTVLVLDTGDYDPDRFPADPETYTGQRYQCGVPCPFCRSEMYEGSEDQRLRVCKFAWQL